MAKGTKICKICGAEYPYCKTVVKPGVFRWQDVACTPEHGEEYLAKIIKSRTSVNKDIESVKDNDAVAVVDENIGGGDERVEVAEEAVTTRKSRKRKATADENVIEG